MIRDFIVEFEDHSTIILWNCHSILEAIERVLRDSPYRVNQIVSITLRESV